MFDPLDELEAALDKVAAAESPIDVVRMRQLIDRAEALWVRSVGAAERSGVWADDGFLSTASWLRDSCRLDHTQAVSTVKLARTLDAMPTVAVAFEAGAISRAHAQVLSYARGHGREAAFDDLDDTLAEVARTLTPQELRRVVQRVTDALDGDGGASRDREQYARRRLHISEGLDGLAYGELVLEPEGKELVLSAIHSAMAGDREPHDDRSYGQRQYDALLDVVRVGMAHLPDGPGRHNPAVRSGAWWDLAGDVGTVGVRLQDQPGDRRR
jgi:uncharacterized protein DUF222